MLTFQFTYINSKQCKPLQYPLPPASTTAQQTLTLHIIQQGHEDRPPYSVCGGSIDRSR